MNTLELKGSRARRRERLRTLKDLDGAALALRDAARFVIDEGIPKSKLRAAIYQQIGETALFQVIVKVSDPASEATDEDAEAWMNAANVIARFIVPLLSVIGLFQLLGYQLSPRLAALEGMRHWRMNKSANYGKLNDLSKHRINTGLIAQRWEDILRVFGSLKLGAVAAPDVMRVLARDGSLSGLGKAVAELGRIAKTLYLLRYISDEAYR